MNTTQTETLAELIERLRSLSIDHGPKGWPAVRTRDVTALLDRIAELEAIGAGGVSGPLMGASLSANAGGEPVAEVVPCHTPSGKRVALRSEAQGLPIGTKLYTHPSPPEGMAAEQALLKVLAAVQRYLPPDGPSAHDTLTEIIEVVDPWPLGQLDKS